MIPVAIDQISAEGIQSLIDNEVRESRTIEYKQTLPGGSNGDKKEFLADVSSFANSAGGDLIYGLSALDGIPQSIVGLNPFNPDQDVLRIENMIRDGLQPRIIGLRTKVVERPENGSVLVIRVPHSLSGPHMVSFGGSSRFFGRSSAGKFQMDFHELRSAFISTTQISERINRWREERLSKIMQGDTPNPIHVSDKIVIHLVPQSSMVGEARIDLEEVQASYQPFEPIGDAGGGWGPRYNTDGIAIVRGEKSYCQVFRNGCLESVYSGFLDKHNAEQFLIPSEWYEQKILEGIARHLRGLERFDVGLPVAVLVTLVGVRNSRMATTLRMGVNTRQIDRDMLLLPNLSIVQTPVNLPRLLKPIFDVAWNSSGVARSLNYDENGNWVACTLQDVPMGVDA